MEQAIRAFIAIELPESVRRDLNTIQQEIQSRAGEPSRRAVRWVPAANIHLTLKVLGEVSTSSLPTLAGVLQAEAAHCPAFQIQIGGLGAFPNVHRPRVIWVGSQAPAELASLQKGIDQATRTLGYPSEDRPFSPHLTLGRINQHARSEDIAVVSKTLSELKVGELSTAQVNQVHLFRSVLNPGGAVYTSLGQFPLSGKQ